MWIPTIIWGPLFRIPPVLGLEASPLLLPVQAFRSLWVPWLGKRPQIFQGSELLFGLQETMCFTKSPQVGDSNSSNSSSNSSTSGNSYNSSNSSNIEFLAGFSLQPQALKSVRPCPWADNFYTVKKTLNPQPSTLIFIEV